MYRWPWRRFEKMFRLHLLRKAREELRQMRDLRIAAMDANSTYDSNENAAFKQERSEGLQKAYTDGVKMLYSDDVPQAPEEDVFENDPLFAPIRKRAEVLQQEINQPLVEEAGMAHLLVGAPS